MNEKTKEQKRKERKDRGQWPGVARSNREQYLRTEQNLKRKSGRAQNSSQRTHPHPTTPQPSMGAPNSRSNTGDHAARESRTRRDGRAHAQDDETDLNEQRRNRLPAATHGRNLKNLEPAVGIESSPAKATTHACPSPTRGFSQLFLPPRLPQGS